MTMTNFADQIVSAFGDWIVTYAAIIFIAAALFAFLFFITVIAAIIRACVLKSRIKKLKAAQKSQTTDPASAEQIDALNAALDEKQAQIDALNNELNEMSMSDGNTQNAAAQNRIDELETELTTKRAYIAELEQKLDDTQSELCTQTTKTDATPDYADKARIAELEKKLATLEAEHKERAYVIKDKDSEINLLKAENAQIKANALQQQLAETRKASAASKTGTSVATASTANAKTAKAAKAEKAAEPATEDDEYDEYFDDYGDENSLIKVTVKFDKQKANWVVLRSDTDRTYRRLATKQEALVIAKDLARRLKAQLVIHKKDGKFQHV